MSKEERKSPEELRREQLTNEYALLSAQYTAVGQKKLSTSDPTVQVQLNQEVRQIYEQLQKIDQELNEMKRGSSDTKQRSSIFDQDFPLLDFNQAKEKFSAVLQEFDVDGQGGSTVLLLQKSDEMLGEICLQGIQDTIRSRKEELKLIRIEFSADSGWNETMILERLAGHIGKLEQVSNPDQYAQMVRHALVGSLRGYTTLFIELHGWENLPLDRQKELLLWFLEEFWNHLAIARNKIAEEFENVHCIAAIVVAGDLETDWYNLPCFNLDSQKDTVDQVELGQEFCIVELPLVNWTQNDIEDWLKRCPKLGRKKSKEVAERVHQISKGLPILSRMRLEKELKAYSPVAS